MDAMMEITDIRIRLIQSEESKLKALATVTLDNCFVIHDIKIIDGNNGVFIAMPSRRQETGEYKDIVHPINTETRNKFSQEILQEYNKALTQVG